MARISLTLVAVVLMMAGCSTAGPDSAQRADVVLREAVVESVDLDSRQVLIRTDTGKMATITAGPRVRNLEQISAGDTVKLAYYEAVALKMTEASDPGGAVAVVGAERAAKGAKPGVVAGVVMNLVVEFVSYDPRTAIATYIAPDGTVQTVQVHPEMRAFAEARTTGERITVAIEQAVAISIEPQ